MSANSAAPRFRLRTNSRTLIVLVAKGLAVALPMFGIFAAHAFLSEATYETTAKLTLTKVAGMESKIPPALSMLRELQEAALDQATLDRLVNGRVDKDTPAAKRDEEAHRIRKAFSIDTPDGKTYAITYRDRDAARAATVCNLLAGRAMRQATRPVETDSGDAGASERQQRMTELLAFLGQHPEVASVGPGSSSPEEDTVAKALVTERAQIDYMLRRIATTANDNPYADPSPKGADRAQLERRLADINAILAQRQKAAEKRDRDKPKVDPAIEAELLTRLRTVQDAPLEARPEERPRFTATLASAALPSSPIKPDRPRELLVGALVGLAAGIIFLVGRAKVAHPGRRSRERDPVAKTTKVSQSAAQPMGSKAPPPLASSPPAPEPKVTALPAHAGSPKLLSSEGSGAPRLLPAAGEATDANPPPVNLSPLVATTVGHGGHGEGAAPPVREVRWNAGGSSPPQEASPPTRKGYAQEAFERPKQIVEVEAVTIERGGVREERGRGADGPRAPTRKITQILGTPAGSEARKPVDARPPVRLESEEGTRPLPDILHMLNGYAGGASTSPPPRGSSPPPRGSSPPPAPEPGPASRTPVPPSGRVFVTALPPPPGWQVDPSLNPARRYGLAQEVRDVTNGGCFVLGVTGSNVELKGRVAAELALALAEESRVLLLEADFQVPTLHQCMRLEMSLSAGYSHQLRVRVLDEHGDGRLKVVECGPTLHVLAEGVMRSPGMILSREFEDSVIGLRAWYEFIVLNGPPTSATVDLQALASVTNGMVLVGSKGGGPTAVFRGKPTFTV